MATSETLTRIPAHSHGLSNIDIPEHRAVANPRSTIAEDTMDVSPKKSNSPREDQEIDQQNEKTSNGATSGSGAISGGASAAAAGGQPKVVQTAFIHKLYNMLEDQSIKHLISWSSSNESFLIQPSSEFSKVLSSFFKHTNISSFVRQLNMYGFHKVSDVFHTTTSETPLWEFKHGNGNFRRGDLQGLRDIKRRASRHSLVHRESYSAPSSKLPPPPQAQTVAAPASAPVPAPPTVEAAPETVESRVLAMEHRFYDMQARMDRAEDFAEAMSGKGRILAEKLSQAYQNNLELTHMISALIREPDHQIRGDISRLQQGIYSDIQSLQGMDMPPYHSHAYGSNEAGAPLSPRQLPRDYDRRGSQPSMMPSRPPFFRPLVPTPKRHPSMGGAMAGLSPPSFRSPQPPQKPLDSVGEETSGYSFARRHTTHDLRTTPGWYTGSSHQHQQPAVAQPNGLSSPFSGGNSSAPYPSSPHHAATDGQNVRDSLAHYKLPGPAESISRRGSVQFAAGPISRPQSPRGADSFNSNGGSSWNNLAGTRPAFKDPFKVSAVDTHPASSGPATRKSSLASNVHNLLNPATSSDRDSGSPGAPEQRDEDRKRRRLV